MEVMSWFEIYLMFGAGIIGILFTAMKNKFQTNSLLPLTIFQITNPTVSNSDNLKLFLIFLKVGAILYGSGYVLFAFLDTELVSTGIITRQQLIDAIAIGQITPGPVFSSVTFIGYQINGFYGALISTIGIFLPSFVFVALLNPIVKKMRASELFSVFLDCVNVASVAIIIAVCYFMGKESVSTWQTSLIFVAGLLVTFGFKKINSAFIVLGGSIAGFILSLI